MARDRKKHASDREVRPTPPPAATVSTRTAYVARIEAAMTTIARALPENPSLGLIWTRLENMHAQAVTQQRAETEAQAGARAWLAAQNEMSVRSAAVSASDKPAP